MAAKPFPSRSKQTFSKTFGFQSIFEAVRQVFDPLTVPWQIFRRPAPKNCCKSTSKSLWKSIFLGKWSCSNFEAWATSFQPANSPKVILDCTYAPKYHYKIILRSLDTNFSCWSWFWSNFGGPVSRFRPIGSFYIQLLSKIATKSLPSQTIKHFQENFFF